MSHKFAPTMTDKSIRIFPDFNSLVGGEPMPSDWALNKHAPKPIHAFSKTEPPELICYPKMLAGEWARSSKCSRV
jgi:hypothetical protein